MPLVPTVVGISRLFHPNVEVVLHDIASDTVLQIWNNLSGRSVGDRSLIEEIPDIDADESIYGPYERVMIDGARTTSVSCVVRDARGVARGVLCINLDRSEIDRVMTALAAIAAAPHVQPRPDFLFVKDWREQIALSVEEWCRDNHVPRKAMVRSDRARLIQELDKAGLFDTRGAAGHAARALGVSRSTVYALLAETRRDSA